MFNWCTLPEGSLCRPIILELNPGPRTPPECQFAVRRRQMEQEYQKQLQEELVALEHKIKIDHEHDEKPSDECEGRVDALTEAIMELLPEANNLVNVINETIKK